MTIKIGNIEPSQPIGAESFQNGIGGYQDNSFLGNSYLACEAEANAVYGYYVPIAQANNMSTFVGCYAESGQTNYIHGRSTWFGQTGSPVYGTGIILTNLQSNTLYFLNDTKNDGTGDSAYCRVGRIGSQSVLEFGFSQDAMTPMSFGYGVVDGLGMPGWAALDYSGFISPLAWSLNNAPEGPGHVWIPHNLYLGNIAARNVITSVSDGPPASGAYANGDFAREASPHLTGMVGFQYVNGWWVAMQPKSTRSSTAGSLDVADYYYGLTEGGLLVTLPAASLMKDGHELVIKDESGQADESPHTIAPDGSDTIDGANAPVSIAAKYGVLRPIQRSNQWWKIG